MLAARRILQHSDNSIPGCEYTEHARYASRALAPLFSARQVGERIGRAESSRSARGSKGGLWEGCSFRLRRWIPRERWKVNFRSGNSRCAEQYSEPRLSRARALLRWIRLRTDATGKRWKILNTPFPRVTLWTLPAPHAEKNKNASRRCSNRVLANAAPKEHFVCNPSSAQAPLISAWCAAAYVAYLARCERFLWSGGRRISKVIAAPTSGQGEWLQDPASCRPMVKTLQMSSLLRRRQRCDGVEVETI